MTRTGVLLEDTQGDDAPGTPPYPSAPSLLEVGGATVSLVCYVAAPQATLAGLLRWFECSSWWAVTRIPQGSPPVCVLSSDLKM